MNWPNRITLIRVALIPVIVVFLQFESPVCRILALIAFLMASLTDWLDGYLARKHKIVTNLGKFLDPVADKLLVLSTMIALCGLGRFPAWVCIVVLFRELAVDGLRLAAVEHGNVIAAGKLGKIKTTLQMAAITLVLLDNAPFGAFPMDQILIYAAVAMTLWSGVDYFLRNGSVLLQGGETR
ncbi:MAG: CDP-diacylglycerol--glycerol-3-phosphate 3-phosphatidyltransferase [Eubacteriales bacterium]|nr:CDP-diacylglycerol--glycerol-3-phosphate 3-phosphatidyltransferase [Eubacteriales bacterium]